LDATQPQTQAWRTRLANHVLRWTLAIELAAMAVMAVGFGTPQARNNLLVLASTHVVILLLAAGRWTSHRVRSLVLIVVFFTVGLGGVATVGLMAGPTMALAVAAVLAGVLLGRHAMAFTVGCAAAGVALVAYAALHGHISGPSPEDVSPHLARTWLRSSGVAILLLLTLGILVTWVVEQVETAMEQGALEAIRRREAERRAADSQKLELVGRLAASLAHDVNNQLTVVRMWSSELGDGNLDAQDLAKATKAINHAVEQASTLSRQLLAMGRQDARAPKHVSLSALVDGYVGTLQRMVTPEITVRVEHGTGDAWARVDESQMHQVILNLVLNARDALPQGGRLVLRTRRVTTAHSTPGHPTPVPPGDWAVLEVEDNGHGMDQATAARVFEPFFTTKAAGQGTGLGLPAVAAIADQSSGHLCLDSGVGRGTTVSLWLPAVEASPLHAPVQPQARPAFHGRTVLLVEDQAANRDVTTKVLKDAGFRVLAAANGDEAVTLLAQPGPRVDVLCSDVVMPGLPVRDVMARYLERHPGGAVLLCSGFVGEELVRRGIEEGHYPVLHKPYAPDALLAALQHVLGSAATQDG
jgi:two-component system cell cycle sensor histidine kinase/response regulator CckA